MADIRRRGNWWFGNNALIWRNFYNCSIFFVIFNFKSFRVCLDLAYCSTFLTILISNSRRTIARMRGLNVDNRELELTSNCTIPEISRGRRHASSSESNFSTSPASSTLPLPDFHQPHSHVNRSYTNTYSSCSSFKLPNIIGKT